MSEAATISPEALRGFVSNVLRSLGVPDADAAKVAALMVEADASGYDTHGVFRLWQYVARLREGGCNPTPLVRVVAERDATALIDGDDGLGHLAMMAACELAMSKARTAGIGWVGIRRGNHAGPAALYVRPQAEAGMIGICAAVGSANHVPPYGGTELLLGTNPIAVAAPSSGADPFILDMATTVAAMGKIKTLAQRGEQMPEGWMVGRDGRPLTDPQRKDEGFLLPIGGPKGFGLSVVVGLLAGTLNGAAFGSDVVDFTRNPDKSSNTGQFVAAIDISAFIEPDLFKSSVKRIFDEMRAVEPLPGHPPVRLPGDGKSERRKSVEAAGIALHPKLLAELEKIASEVGIPSLT